MCYQGNGEKNWFMLKNEVWDRESKSLLIVTAMNNDFGFYFKYCQNLGCLVFGKCELYSVFRTS